MKNIFAILAIFMTLAAEAKPIHIYCMQTTPATAHGFILEEAGVEFSNGTFRFIPGRVGTGLTNEQGDGTIGDMLLESDQKLPPSPEDQASSAQWKDAVPFQLPIEGARYVLYIQKSTFTATKDEDVPSARMKVNDGRKERNYILMCNLL